MRPWTRVSSISIEIWTPSAIAHLLHGSIVWRDERQGEWAAVLHFNRPQVASLKR